MKDEEMAEESLISYRKDPKWAGKMFMQDENTCYKDGFLAGLKARLNAINLLTPELEKLSKAKTQQLTKAKEIIKELYEGLDKLYLSGLSAKQIAFIEQLQDKTEQFLKEIEK